MAEALPTKPTIDAAQSGSFPPHYASCELREQLPRAVLLSGRLGRGEGELLHQ